VRVSPAPAVDCVCLAYTASADTRLFHLGTHTANSPWGAVLWLSWRASHVADQLDATAARPVRVWLADDAEQHRALTRLGGGASYFLLIREGAVHYLLSATPGP
jgi:hypothetical protein